MWGVSGRGIDLVSLESLDPLLQPFELKNVRLRNRIVSPSHEPGYAADGLPLSRYRAYHVEKAKGGIAMTMIGGGAIVAPDSPPSFGNLVLYRDEIVKPLSELAEAVHEHGAAVMCQVTHLGRRTSHYGYDWLPAVAPSMVREPVHRAFPKIAESWDIERIVGAYATAAARCQAAGLDGIELEAYGHLLDAFWSPLTNERDDEWGGDAERRMRFPIAVIRSVREAVGPHFVVGIRMSVDEDAAGGIDLAHGIEIAQRLVSEGIDFISVIKGSISTHLAQARVVPPLGTPAAPHLSVAGEVRRAVSVPVLHAARIADVATARHAIREGLVDLVGMMRAHVADPYLAHKVAAGVEDTIRPCVGAAYCIDSGYAAEGAMLCIHNVSTGREDVLPHIVPPAPARKRAVVVGGGPGGLEAARALAERGHNVVLFEASDDVGGQLRIAASAPRRHDLIGIVDWRLAECRRMGVDIRLGVYADADAVRREEPDIVIVATGGIPNKDFLSFGSAIAHDTWDVLTRGVRLRGEVVVYDDNGTYPALDTVELLLADGARVIYVSPDRTFAPEVGSVNYPAYLATFGENLVECVMNTRLIGAEKTDGRVVAHLLDEYSGRTRELAVDHVVVEHGTIPVADLYFDLLEGSFNRGEVDLEALIRVRPQTIRRDDAGRYQVFRIGDAVASRNVHAAMLDAYRLALAV
jgi:N-methyl-L-proline demethylase